MAWPPAIPPDNRSDASAQLGDHPDDHNMIASALAEIVSRGTSQGRQNCTISSPWSGIMFVEEVSGVVVLTGFITRSSVTLNGPITFGQVPTGYRPAGASAFGSGAWDTTTGGDAVAGSIPMQVDTGGYVLGLSRVQAVVRATFQMSWVLSP